MPATKKSSTSARRVLHAAGRPLRRVSRLVHRTKVNGLDVLDEEIPLDEDGYGSMLHDTANGGHDHSVMSYPHRSPDVRSLAPVAAPSDDRDWIVWTMESTLRQILLLLGAYLLGASEPQWYPVVRRLAEYFSVAWATCVVIMILSVVIYPEIQREEQVIEERVPLLVDERGLSEDMELFVKVSEEEDLEEGPKTKYPHPSLEQFIVINNDTLERMIPNTLQPYVLENELFDGTMMLMIRTPDVDDPSVPPGTPENMIFANYFRGKQRRFEFQYQVKLKQVPKGRIFFSCELEEPIKMGMIQKAFVGAAMAFTKRMNNNFQFSLSGSKDENNDGKYEKPHMSFTVEGSMDRLLITKPGQPIPKLGEPLEEDPESLKRRKKGEGIDWNTEDTYTFAVWSAYADFLDWKCLNLPGIRPFNLSSVIATQHINLTLYTIPEHLAADKHYRCDMVTVTNIEMSNTIHTTPGPSAKKWLANHSNELRVTTSGEDDEVGMVRGLSADEDDEGDQDDDIDEEAETVQELGKGIYLCSGDSVILEEAGNDIDVHPFPGCVANGGGFAVIQEQASSTIVIEKGGRSLISSRKPTDSTRARSKLIKSGDKVMIKLVTKNKSGDQSETKYLSIHRGWWLKWVTIPPTKNGYFTIHTHESEFNPSDGKVFQSSPETQTSYLTLGGAFWLRHQRWSKYQVGISAEESPAYGGRMLGLYMPDASGMGGKMRHPDEDNDGKLDMDDDEVGEKGKHQWMRPLQLRAQPATMAAVVDPNATAEDDFLLNQRLLGKFIPQQTMIQPLLAGNFQIDVPVWIEMMHRAGRRRQLLYVIRVSVDPTVEQAALDETLEDSPDEEKEDGDNAIRSFVRIRTGDELASLIRLGQTHKRQSVRQITPVRVRKRTSSSMSVESLTKGRPAFNMNDDDDGIEAGIEATLSALETNAPPGTPSPSLSLAVVTLQPSDVSKSPGSVADEQGHSARDGELEQIEWDGDSSDEDEDSEGHGDEYVDAYHANDDLGLSASDLTPLRHRKGRKFIGQIAKSVKTGTSKTSKQVVKQSKKVGKGTVTAGKAIIAPISRGGVRPKQPPAKEPKSMKAKASEKANQRRTARDHHVIVNRTMKRMERIRSKQWPAQNPSILAGQLAASDQSCRTASHLLSQIHSETAMSPNSKEIISTLVARVAPLSENDLWFLQGGAIQLGIVPMKHESKLLHECVVARCLWESHWREEWCGIYGCGIFFYAPLTKKPSMQLSFIDIESVRELEMDDYSVLPGLSVLVVETAWQCHYLAFSAKDIRGIFHSKLNEAIYSFSVRPVDSDDDRLREKDLWKARFWQGFQSAAEASMARKWAKVSSGTKALNRIVLNGRRMMFDLDPLSSTNGDDESDLRRLCKFVEGLLSTSLVFSMISLREHPEAFVKFVDATSHLRSLTLENIDLSSGEALCMFVNLYHCLLQHAMLLSVKGPLNKRSVSHFMRSTCYEIGGDVFSLAELQCCVIRGKLSRPVAPKHPYIEAPRKSNAYRLYAIDRVDWRINFVLNTGDTSCPQSVAVLNPETLEQQLDMAAMVFIRSQMLVDASKRVITLPKICEVYRNDFGNGDQIGIINNCLPFLDEVERTKVKNLLRDDILSPVIVKFQHTSDQYHLCLILRKEKDTTGTELPEGGRPITVGFENGSVST